MDIHGIRKKKFYHGIRPFRVGRGTFMESGRSNFITVYDLLGWGGRTLMESGRNKIIMGYDPLRWGGTMKLLGKKLSWDTTL